MLGLTFKALNAGVFVSAVSKFFGTNYNGTSVELAQQSDLDECFQSVSNGKSLIASAITDKGVSTAATATFQQMANNIDKIEEVTDSMRLLTEGWEYRSSVSAIRNELPEVSGTCTLRTSDSTEETTLTPYQYNTTSHMVTFRRGTSSNFAVEVPSITFNGSKITFSGYRRILVYTNERQYVTYRVRGYDPSTNKVTVSVPSFNVSSNGITYYYTCTNLVVIARISLSVFASPPDSDVYFDDADFPLSYS